MEKQRKYDKEFTLNTMKSYQENGKNLGEVAKNLGLWPFQLRSALQT